MTTRSSSSRGLFGTTLVLTLLAASQAAATSAHDLPSPVADATVPGQTGICVIVDEPSGAVGTPQASPGTGSRLPPSGLGQEDCPAGPPPSASPVASPSAVAQAVLVQSGEFWFDPREVVIPAAGTTTLVLANSGVSVHNLTVDELGIQILASRGRSGETTIQDPPPGAYQFYCSISGHREAGMVGTIVVE